MNEPSLYVLSARRAVSAGRQRAHPPIPFLSRHFADASPPWPHASPAGTAPPRSPPSGAAPAAATPSPTAGRCPEPQEEQVEKAACSAGLTTGVSHGTRGQVGIGIDCSSMDFSVLRRDRGHGSVLTVRLIGSPAQCS